MIRYHERYHGKPPEDDITTPPARGLDGPRPLMRVAH